MNDPAYSAVVLDACCGARMFWFDAKDQRALFMDIRDGEWEKDCGTPATKGRKPFVIHPDINSGFYTDAVSR